MATRLSCSASWPRPRRSSTSAARRPWPSGCRRIASPETGSTSTTASSTISPTIRGGTVGARGLPATSSNSQFLDPAASGPRFIDEAEFRREWAGPGRVFAVGPDPASPRELLADPAFHYHLPERTRATIYSATGLKHTLPAPDDPRHAPPAPPTPRPPGRTCRSRGPTIDEETIAGVAEVLRSGWITSGPQVKAFEARLSEYFGGRPGRGPSTPAPARWRSRCGSPGSARATR